MKTSLCKLIVVKVLLIEWITVPQNSVICAYIDCNQPAMTALYEYSDSLAWLWIEILLKDSYNSYQYLLYT